MSADPTEQQKTNAHTLRDEWIHRLSDLTRSVKAWAEDLDWSTRQIGKNMKDSRLGPYEAPALMMQKGTTRVLLDPIARFTPGTDGVVDLYLMPAYDDIASLFFLNGEWRLQYLAPGTTSVAHTKHAESRALSKEALGQILEKMSTHAAETL